MQFQQSSSSGRKMTVTLASNTDIADRTLEHARRLVHDLQKLGGDFANFRRNMKSEMQSNTMESEQSEQPSERPVSPWMDETTFPPHLQDAAFAFRTRLFLFSLPKIYQRLHKKYKQTSRGLAFVDIAQKLPDGGNVNSVNILREMSRVIGWMLRHLTPESASFPDSKVEDLVDGVICVADMTRQLFESDSWFADLFRALPEVVGKFFISLPYPDF
jgi:hypothetical protein